MKRDNTLKIKKGNEVIDVNFEKRKVIIEQRYEWLYIFNDLMLGVWFVVGSILFFYKQLTYWGTWLFLIGSAQMMIRPGIQMAHKLHMRKYATPPEYSRPEN